MQPFLEEPLLKTSQTIGLKGLYKLVVRDALTHDVKRETDWFENIILDSGLNRLGTGNFIGFMHIGTGVSIPAAGDTGLATLAATTSTYNTGSLSNLGGPSYISSRIISYRFNAGVLNGNYTEVGIGWSSSLLFSRALILDGSALPTSISVGITEYLDVYYQLRIVPDLTDHVSNVTIGGVVYSVTRRPAFVSDTNHWRPPGQIGIATGIRWGAYNGNNAFRSTNGTLGAVTAGPSGTLYDVNTSATLDAYVNNSNESSGSTSFSLDQMNLSGGIKSMLVACDSCTYQYEFDTSIPKDNTKVMTLQGKVNWARI
jgi:hypothetical protein